MVFIATVLLLEKSKLELAKKFQLINLEILSKTHKRNSFP